MFGAKLIDICIKKLPQQTFFAIIGLMLGSPLVIYLKFQAQSNENFVFNGVNITASVIVFAAGVLIALAFGSEKLKARITKASSASEPEAENETETTSE